MFKQVVIQLTNPICACPLQPYSWLISMKLECGLARPQLCIFCDDCHAQIEVEPDDLLGVFEFDSEQPPEKPKNHLRLVKDT